MKAPNILAARDSTPVAASGLEKRLKRIENAIRVLDRRGTALVRDLRKQFAKLPEPGARLLHEDDEAMIHAVYDRIVERIIGPVINAYDAAVSKAEDAIEDHHRFERKLMEARHKADAESTAERRDMAARHVAEKHDAYEEHCAMRAAILPKIEAALRKMIANGENTITIDVPTFEPEAVEIELDSEEIDALEIASEESSDA